MASDTMPYTADDKTRAQLTKAFVYHPPKADQIPRYGDIRAAARSLAEVFVGQVPPSRELSLAMTKLEEAVMWANAGIARNE